MLKTLTCLALMALTVSAFAVEKHELDNRVRKLKAKFDDLQRQPEKAIPAETLAKAQGIVLLDRTKGGFIFAYEGGTGLSFVRQGKEGKWGAGSFMSASEASLGLQLGGQQSFVVILLMNTNVTLSLCNPKIEFGGSAQGTAGTDSGTAEGTVSSDPFSNEHSILVYSDRKGLYGGAAVKGGSLAADETANEVYYNQPVTIREILFEKKVQPGQTMRELTGSLNASAKKE
jgi:lipid-binding SYLF domain-containing protein